jgi:glucosamine kinase
MDGRLPVSGLSTAVYAFFSNDLHRLVTWANQANSTAFAELAPLVIQQSQTGDAAAIQLLKQAAQAIDRVAAALADKQQQSSPLPCALVGGIAPFLEPYLGQTLRGRLRPCQATPEEGAILLVRHYLKEKS